MWVVLPSLSAQRPCRVDIQLSVTRHIVGYKKEESDAILKFLYDHIGFGADFQARVKWAKGSVVVWDVSDTCGKDGDLS